MALLEWRCGHVTIVGALPLGPRPPTESELADHMVGCRTCNLLGGAA